MFDTFSLIFPLIMVLEPISLLGDFTVRMSHGTNVAPSGGVIYPQEGGGWATCFQLYLDVCVEK